MKTFLSKISQLDNIRDVLLLSKKGDPLFSSLHSGSDGNRKAAAQWTGIIDGLDNPQAADLVFDEGRYYLRSTEIGYVIIGMTGDRNLQKIKAACDGTLHKLSDTSLRRKILLKMLKESDDFAKSYIIKALVPMADAEVAAVLIDLLKKAQHFEPDAKDQLLRFICQTLGYCNAYEAIEPLKSFLTKGRVGMSPRFSEEIGEAVRISVQQLEQNAPRQTEVHPPSSAQEAAAKGEQKTTEKKPPPPEEKKGGSHFLPPRIPQTDKINALLDNGNKDQAMNLILNLISENAKKKQFQRADQLREWLIAIDPMALMPIVRAAEIIEEEKLAAINPDHLEIWKDLTDKLTGEEFSSLYHAMVLKNYANGEMIARQGAALSTLFFINRGRVQIQAVDQRSVIPLNTKEAGEVIGAGTFFEASVWTVNVRSMGAELFLLSRRALDALIELHPSIESKLSHFCSSFQSTSSLLKKIRKNRRQVDRKKISGRITFTVLDKNGDKTRVVAKGDLRDISKGGMAFSIRSSMKKNAVSLFGRKLEISIGTGITGSLIIFSGVVRAVKHQDLISNEYSIHLKFDTFLSSNELQKVIDGSAGSG